MELRVVHNKCRLWGDLKLVEVTNCLQLLSSFDLQSSCGGFCKLGRSSNFGCHLKKLVLGHHFHTLLQILV